MFGKKKNAVEGSLRTYGVVYLGGHPNYPKKKVGEISLNIMPDCFYLTPTTGSQNWFSEFKIGYDSISKFEIVQRQVSTVEGLLGGVNSRQLNQPNNIHITYANEQNDEITLRLEMLTGVSVMGQAAKCSELLDFLKVNGILNKFKGDIPSEQKQDDIPAQIEKLSGLKDKGIITEDEFTAKKAELLAKM